MRQNAPALIDPHDAVRRATDRNLGIPQQHDVQATLAQFERLFGQQNRELNQLRGMLAMAEVMAYASPDILTTMSLKGNMTATNVTSTSGTTITNSNMTLTAGVRYLVVAIAGMAMNAPAGQSIVCCTRIGSAGATIDGTMTTTVGGERWGMSISFLNVVGTGGSLNIAGRARVTGGTGTINDAISAGIAIPQGAMVEV